MADGGFFCNAGQNPASLNGWSVQYASATSDNWHVTALPAVTLQPGQYFLVAEGGNTNGTSPLPTPDAAGSIAMSATAGKVALVHSTSALSGTCPSSLNIADLVGYGSTASCNEGGANTSPPSAATAALRKNAGCTDTNVNSADFEVLSPTPRNTASTRHVCPPPSAPTGTAGVNPSPVMQGDTATISVMVVPAENPTSTGLQVTADTTSIGGIPGEVFADAGSNLFTLTRTIPCSQAVGPVNLPATITDAQGRTGSLTITFNVISGSPAIVTQPDDVVACSGSTITFNVTATGTGLTWQWYDQSGPLANGGGVSGANTSTLTLSGINAARASASPYYLRITGSCDPENPAESNHVNLTIGGATAADRRVVISQIFAGAGCSGSGCAPYDSDYIELYNRGPAPVDLSGWSIQYGSINGSWTVTPLGDFILLAGQYYLIKEASGTAGTGQKALPTPNVSGNINLSSSSGYIALYKNANPIASNTCPVNNDCFLVDFVGYGTSASCFEGTGSATSPATTTCLRRSPVCTDSNWNAGDFVIDIPNPHAAAIGGTGVPADLNFDGQVDAADLDMLIACMADTKHPLPYDPAHLPPGCTAPKACDNRIQPDLERNGIIDLNDFGRFQRCLGFGNSAGVPANCGN